MIGTENLEEKLSQVLNDPNSMAQLMSFAQSLGMGPPDAPPPPGPPPGPSSPICARTGEKSSTARCASRASRRSQAAR